MVRTRHLISAAMSSWVVSTRLASWTPAKVTGGMALVEPSLPVRVIDFSHSPAEVPSPGSGKEWASAHESTSR
jgi:hypothetical protein